MIISVINQKGGVGKTTTAINTAVCIAQQLQSTLLVDLDPQGNASSGLGLRELPRPTLYQSLISATNTAAIHSNRDISAVQSVYLANSDEEVSRETPEIETPEAETSEVESKEGVLVPASWSGEVPGLEVIGATPELAGSEIELAGNERRDDLKTVLDALSKRHPLILIDTPPSLSLLTINALVAADFLIIPVQCEYFALEGLGHLLRTLELIKRSMNPSLQVLGLVRTMYDGRLGLSSQVSQELEKHFPQLLFNTIIPRNVRLAEAPSHGQPITLYDRRSPGADAYRRLAVEVLQRLGAQYDRKETRYRLPAESISTDTG